jgi:DNA polymerase-3 subunit beta
MENQCFFKIGNTDIISRVIDGQFPNYKQVMPKDFISFSVLDTKKFTESLKRVMILTKEPTYKIILNFSKDQLVMESKLQDIGETQEIIDIEYSGNDISLGINSQYLMDSIREIDSISFKISITGNMSPVTITPENSADYVSVIMPIQIKQAD